VETKLGSYITIEEKQSGIRTDILRNLASCLSHSLRETCDKACSLLRWETGPNPGGGLVDGGSIPAKKRIKWAKGRSDHWWIYEGWLTPLSRTLLDKSILLRV